MGKEEQGVSQPRYMLIPRVLVFVRRGQDFLLIKGASQKRLWAGLYNGVGGHLEPGEDWLSAAKRELFEETGLIVNLRLCGMVTVNVEQAVGVGMSVFTGEYTQGDLIASREGEPQWINRAELEHLPLVADVKPLIEKISQMKAGDPPFSARSYYDQAGSLVIEFH